MSPKRLSDLPHCHLMWNVAGVAGTSPELRSLAATLIAMFSWVSHARSLIATLVMEHDHAAVSAIFASIRSPGLLRAAVNAAARTNLPPEDADLCARVLLLVEPLEGIRNSFAHSLWLSSEDLPGRLILLDPKYLSAAVAVGEGQALARARAIKTTEPDGSTRWTFPIEYRIDTNSVSDIRKNGLVYDVEELRELTLKMVNAYEALEWFHELVKQEGHPAEARARLLRMLPAPPTPQPPSSGKRTRPPPQSQG